MAPEIGRLEILGLVFVYSPYNAFVGNGPKRIDFFSFLAYTTYISWWSWPLWLRSLTFFMYYFDYVIIFDNNSFHPFIPF